MKKLRVDLNTFGGVLVLFIIAVGAFGWGWNIVKLIASDTVTIMVLVRLAGIFFAPVGAIVGYL